MHQHVQLVCCDIRASAQHVRLRNDLLSHRPEDPRSPRGTHVIYSDELMYDGPPLVAKGVYTVKERVINLGLT